MKLADYEQKKELAVFDKDFYAPPSARMRDGGEPTEAFDVKACVCFLRRAIRGPAGSHVAVAVEGDRCHPNSP